jgi:hypothetical protein
MAFCKSYTLSATGGTSVIFDWIDCNNNSYGPETVNGGFSIDADGTTYPCVLEGSINVTGSDYSVVDNGGCGSSTVYTFSGCMDGTQFSVSGVPFTNLVDSTIYRMDFNRWAVSAECATYYSALTSGGTVYSVLGNYYDLNTGYTCASSACTSAYTDCVNSSGVYGTDYCLRGTGFYDDNYIKGPNLYNFKYYYTGQTTGFFVFFSSSVSKWCLSNQLDGPCYLQGPSGTITDCPNLSTVYWSEEFCLTPTPTPTINCDALEFEALFDCEVTPTPTPSSTVPTTPTPTPTPTDITCSGTGISATLVATTPTVTPTITSSPTPSSPLNRPCNFMGVVTFTTVDTEISCPSSQQFQDCFTGLMYYTTGEVAVPGGGSLEKFGVYLSIVNNVSLCLGYIGVNYDVIGVDNIILLQGPLGYLNLGGCLNCTPEVSLTPTTTASPTPTPTITNTPTSSPIPTYYVYQRCGSPTTFLIQNQPGPVLETDSIFKDTGRNECWQYKFSQQNTSPSAASLGTPYITNYNGNYFIGPYLYERASCATCLSS